MGLKKSWASGQISKIDRLKKKAVYGVGGREAAEQVI